MGEKVVAFATSLRKKGGSRERKNEVKGKGVRPTQSKKRYRAQTTTEEDGGR